MRIPAWRSFLACGLAVTAVYFLLPDSEQLTAAGSAAFAYSAAVAVVAGALPYTRYSPLTRWMMRRIVAKAKGDTDTSRDYEYTDWEAVRRFAGEFALRVSEQKRPGIAPAAGSAAALRP